MSDRLRALPATDQLARLVRAQAPAATAAEATAAARATLDDRRAALRAGEDGPEPDLAALAVRRLHGSLRRVLNLTGVVVHTNLGRAPLPEAAVAATAEAARGYVDLELDLATGRRGGRGAGATRLLCELTGAEDALVVNNGAAAVLLAAAALGGPGRRIAVSRGQLVEIGGGFRIPEVVAQAGADLVEVGTTNRTRLGDYASAHADVLLRVHPSNFRSVGFVEDVEVEALCTVGPPVIDDVGSGVLAAGLELLGEEPPVRRSVAAGAAVVCCSADKLLGGPQAGLLVGRAEAVERCRRHPLHRALRPGRLVLAALEATLRLHRDPERACREIPVLRALTHDPATLQDRARRLAAATGGEVVDHVGKVGGGALPLLELPGPAVALPRSADGPDAQAARLRAGDPPVLGRITGDRVVLDPRALSDAEVEQAVAALRT